MQILKSQRASSFLSDLFVVELHIVKNMFRHVHSVFKGTIPLLTGHMFCKDSKTAK